jgi:hypothetical protein
LTRDLLFAYQRQNSLVFIYMKVTLTAVSARGF